MRRALRDVCPDVSDWSGLGAGGSAAWARFWPAVLAKFGGIVSSSAKPYRRYNFERCAGPRRQGQIIRHEDGVSSWVPYRCGESLCPDCADKVGADLGREYAQVFEAIARAQAIRRVWFVVATIPREFEHVPVPGSDEGRRLRRGLAVMLRSALGQKSRAQVPMYIATHAVGDRSLMRPRVHYHAGVVPLVRDGDHIRAIPIRSLDVDALRAQWGAVLHNVFGVDPAVAQLHVSWVDVLRSPGKCHHRVMYDCRAFGADFRDSPLMWSPSTGLVVVREGDDWRLIHAVDLAAQWARVRQQREVRPYGPLQYRRRVAEQLGIEQITEDVPPVIDEWPAVEWRYRVKRITAEGRVKWHEVVTYWLDLPEGWRFVPGEVSAGRGGSKWQVRNPKIRKPRGDVERGSVSPAAPALWVPLVLPGLAAKGKSGEPGGITAW